MTPGLLILVAGACTALGLFVFRAPRVWLVATMVGAAAALAASVWVLVSGQTWDWRLAVTLGGEGLHLRLDAHQRFLPRPARGASAGRAACTRTDIGRTRAPRFGARRVARGGAPLLASMALGAALRQRAAFPHRVGVFSVGAYFLITLERHRSEVRSAGWLYLAASHAATLCLFVFFRRPRRRAREAGNLARCAIARSSRRCSGSRSSVSGSRPACFRCTSGCPPRTPTRRATCRPSSPASRSRWASTDWCDSAAGCPSPDAAGWVVAALGAASAVLGVAFALGQHDLKRLLAYHSVENIGIILIGLGFAMVAAAHGAPTWGRLALAGELLHVWNHGLFKALLFLGAGSVLHATGTREMSRLGGLWRAMPWTAGLFALGRGGDLRPAAAQRFRQRVARVSRPVRRRVGARSAVVGRRCPRRSCSA